MVYRYPVIQKSVIGISESLQCIQVLTYSCWCCCSACALYHMSFIALGECDTDTFVKMEERICKVDAQKRDKMRMISRICIIRCSRGVVFHSRNDVKHHRCRNNCLVFIYHHLEYWSPICCIHNSYSLFFSCCINPLFLLHRKCIKYSTMET